MVMDRETSAQDKCASLLEEVLLNNITPYKEYVEGLTCIACQLEAKDHCNLLARQTALDPD